MLNFLIDGRAAVADAATKAGPYAARHRQRRGAGRHGSGRVERSASAYVGGHARLGILARLHLRLHGFRPRAVHVAPRGGW